MVSRVLVLSEAFVREEKDSPIRLTATLYKKKKKSCWFEVALRFDSGSFKMVICGPPRNRDGIDVIYSWPDLEILRYFSAGSRLLFLFLFFFVHIRVERRRERERDVRYMFWGEKKEREEGNNEIWQSAEFTKVILKYYTIYNVDTELNFPLFRFCLPLERHCPHGSAWKVYPSRAR